jgi:hypothetical protein
VEGGFLHPAMGGSDTSGRWNIFHLFWIAGNCGNRDFCRAAVFTFFSFTVSPPAFLCIISYPVIANERFLDIDGFALFSYSFSVFISAVERCLSLGDLTISALLPSEPPPPLLPPPSPLLMRRGIMQPSRRESEKKK